MSPARELAAASLLAAMTVGCGTPDRQADDSTRGVPTDSADERDDTADTGSGDALDVDGDGYTRAQGDCDDELMEAHPGAIELPQNGFDENCDGSDWIVGAVGEHAQVLPGSIDHGRQGWQVAMAADAPDSAGVLAVSNPTWDTASEGAVEHEAEVAVYSSSSGGGELQRQASLTLQGSFSLGNGLGVATVDGSPNWMVLGGSETVDVCAWPTACTGDCTLAEATTVFAGNGEAASSYDVASNVDLDGDGLVDLSIPTAANSSSDFRAWLTTYLGPVSASSINAGPDHEAASGNTATISPVIGAQDLTGDGYADLLATENEFGAIAEGGGRVYLLAGGAGLVADLSDGYAVIDGTLAHGNLGRGLASGDIDGDGADDACLSVPLDSTVAERSGLVGCLLGPVSPGGHTADELLAVSTGEAEGAYYGQSLQALDLDSDGDAELAVAAANEAATDGTGGLVYLLDFSDPGSGLAASVVNVFGGSNQGDEFGHAMSAGDLDGDGRDDLAVGAPFAVVDGNKVGAAWYFAGNSGAW